MEPREALRRLDDSQVGVAEALDDPIHLVCSVTAADAENGGLADDAVGKLPCRSAPTMRRTPSRRRRPAIGGSIRDPEGGSRVRHRAPACRAGPMCQPRFEDASWKENRRPTAEEGAALRDARRPSAAPART